MKNFNLKSYLTFLSRNKAYTAINVFGLAVSLMFVIIIGLYTWQEYAVDRQHSKADRIYCVGLEAGDGETPRATCPHGILKYLRKHYPEIERTCGFVSYTLKLKGRNEKVQTNILMVDTTFFSMFDFPLLRGDRASCLNGKDCMVVTESFARRFFGTDNVVGRAVITADSMRFRITGVVKDFDNTIIDKEVGALIDFAHCEKLAPYYSDKYFPQAVTYSGNASFVQVCEDCDFKQKEVDVQQYVNTFMPRERYDGTRPILIPLSELYFSGLEGCGLVSLGDQTLVTILFAVGLVILLFAVMNYVNLTVAQSGYRAREMATRRLFGCSGGGIVATMFLESLVMCLASCLIAVGLAVAAAPHAGRLLGTKLDTSLLLHPVAAVGLLLFVTLVGLAAGALPAAVLAKVKPIEVVRGTFTRRTKMLFSRVFIVVQNVITISMLACTLIMSMQIRHLVTAPLGFDTADKLTIYSYENFVGSDFPVFLDRLRALPGVKSIAVSNGTPADGGYNIGLPLKGDTDITPFQYFYATPGFMDMFGITLNTDRHAEGDAIVYLNEAALNKLGMKATDSHLSDRFPFRNLSGFPDNLQFGGVFNNFRVRSILDPQWPMFILIIDKPEQPSCVTLQTDGDPMETYAAARKIYKEVFHEELSQWQPPTVTDQIAQVFEKEQHTTHIVMLFALIAIIISTLGLVAMSTYFIRQRAKEIAIRKVFGSTGNQIRARLIRTFLLHVAVAFVIAVPIVVWLMHKWISEYSYRITWWPWIIVAGAAVLLISYAAVAIQSHIAGNENPVKNIKQE